MTTKQEVIEAVCEHLGIPTLLVSTGSTEPKGFLIAVAEQLGIQGLTVGMDKPALGRLIVEAGGNLWLPEFDSRGGTITKDGLAAIQETVFRLTP